MSEKSYRVYICCGRNCGPKGSPQLVDFMEREVARLALGEKVTIYPGGCQSHCDSGPTMVVFPGPVFYQEVDRFRITRIALEHLANDTPVQEYFWVDALRVRHANRPPIPNKTYVPPPAYKSQGSSEGERHKDRYQSGYKRPQKDVDDFKW